MYTRFLLSAIAILCLPAVLLAQPARRDDRDLPHDYILIVDVSGSMTDSYKYRGRDYKPSDPQGYRWDGLQFAIDVARPDDRIALVLFRADAVVLTKLKGLDEKTGFVSLSEKYGEKTGRERLKAIIAEIQAQEQAARGKPALDAYKFASLGGATVPLTHGTSVKLALERVVEEKLLDHVGRDRQAWALLFTDGFEEPPTGAGAAYNYVAELRRIEDDRAAMEAMIRREKWVEKFREAGAPVITFGLGEAYNKAFLQVLSAATQRSDDPAARYGASYDARTNIEMLRQLRNVAWELRQNWQLELSQQSRDGEEQFYTPPVGAWHDLGVLVYRTREGKTDAAAPLPGDVEWNLVKPDNTVEKRPAWFEPLRSQSHWYHYLPPAADRPADLAKLDGKVNFVVNHQTEGDKNYTTHAVAALRTKKPLFEYQKPAHGAKYSPKDAIPFQVDFLPDADNLFKPEQFEVKVELIPAGPAGQDAQSPFRNRTLKLEHAGAGKAGGSAFRGELLLDPEPGSTAWKGFRGPYHVDVTITGIEGKGPLARATRRLIRRTIEIGDYPSLALPKDPVSLSNKNAQSIGTEWKVGLNLTSPSEKPDSIAKLEAYLERVPAREGGVGIPKDAFILKGETLNVDSKGGTLRLELPLKAWEGLAEGAYTGGVIRVKAPWMTEKEAPSVVLNVTKTRYGLTVGPAAVDLSVGSGKPGEPIEKTVNVSARLDTELQTKEKAAIYPTKDNETPEKKMIDFVAEDPKAAPAKVAVEVAGLGKAVELQAQEFASLPLVLTAREKLPPGRYSATFWLLGANVTPTPVTVRVVADQPVVELVQGEKSQRISQLSLFGLAGTTVERTLKFHSALPGKTVDAVKLLNGAALTDGKGGRFEAVVEPDPGAKDQVKVRLKIPEAATEGFYTGALVFEAALKAAPALPVEVPASVFVQRYGVTPSVNRLRLAFPDPCKPNASGSLNLRGRVDIKPGEASTSAPVRWWVEEVEPEKNEFSDTLLRNRLRLQLGDSVLLPTERRGENSLAGGDPVSLAVGVSSEGLQPGKLYRTRLRFHSWVESREQEGGTPEVDVELLVPARRVEFAPYADSARAGRDAALRVRVWCAGCEPGRGEVILGADRDSPLERVAVPDLGLGRPDPQVPGAMIYEAAVKVRPEQAGVNPCRLLWEPFCPPSANGNEQVAEVHLNVTGIINVEKKTIARAEDEEALVWVVAASTTDATSLRLQAVNPGDDEPTLIELTEADPPPSGLKARPGQRIFSARCSFPGVGDYELSPDSNSPTPLSLEPATVHVALDLKQPYAKLGTIYPGRGDTVGTLGGLLGMRSDLTVRDAVRVGNGRQTPCKWTARLRMPEARPIDVQLVGRAGGEDLGPASVLEGSLAAGEEMALGVACKARDEGFEPRDRNDMAIELTLTWDDEDLKWMGSRVVWVGTSEPDTEVYVWGGAAVVGALAVVLSGVVLARRRVGRVRVRKHKPSTEPAGYRLDDLGTETASPGRKPAPEERRPPAHDPELPPAGPSLIDDDLM